ncbi:MFS transporter [Pueribacillus sp. YX66]|uniref:MFS transporter n=1 Tax=Pueribacillus sp. YX66 TaxID=3229242 RepID=UPI00358CDE39
MRILEKVLGSIEVTRSLKLLIFIGGLYSLSIALSNTFVNVFLWKQTGEIIDIALYNLAIVISQPLAFIVAGKLAKKIDRIVVLRIGVILLSFFYLTVLFFGNNANSYIIVLGILLGTGYGFYWLAYNVLTFEITEPETRDFFNGFLGIMTSFSGIIGPIFAGFVISSMEKFTGYKIIFLFSLALFVGAVVLSFFLKRRSAKGFFAFQLVFQEQKVNKNWRNVLIAHFFQGLREGVFTFIIVIWVYITTKSEMAIGTFSFLMSFTQLIAYYVVARFISEKYRKKAILAGGVILYLSILIIVFNVTYPALLVYAVIISVAYPLLLVPYQSITYDVIGTARKAAEHRVEYIVFRELYVNLGRILSIVTFVLCVHFFKEQSIRYVMLILGSGHFILYFFIKNVSLKKRVNEAML